MMNVLIVEDEALAAERLNDLIVRYDPSVNVLHQLDSISGTLSFLRNNYDQIDLIFLDIQLADGKSFEIFREFNVMTPVIFTTAYDEYAMEAFELNSIDYLMKPIAEQSLKKAMDKFSRVKHELNRPPVSRDLAKQLINRKPYKQRFVVQSGKRILFKNCEQIAYFFAQDKSCFLVEGEENKKFLIDHTLEQLESLLDPSAFFRINRSVIIHISHIKEVRSHFGKRLTIIPKIPSRDDLTVSRSRVGDFRKWLEG